MPEILNDYAADEQVACTTPLSTPISGECVCQRKRVNPTPSRLARAADRATRHEQRLEADGFGVARPARRPTPSSIEIS